MKLWNNEKMNGIGISILFVFLSHQIVTAQCTGSNNSVFVTVNAPAISSGPITLSTCNWRGEYNQINNAVAGNQYTVTISNSNCITVHQGAYNGTVVAYGTSSVTFTAPTNGTYFLYYTTNCSGCGTGSGCRTTTIENISPIPPINGCSGTFTDAGGTGNYPNNSRNVWTYCPDNPGSYLSVNFTNFNTEAWYDALYVYNGNSTSSPLIGMYTGNTGTPGEIISPTPGGCLTFYFYSDNTGTAPGWSANISCYSSIPNSTSDCSGTQSICSNATFSISPNGVGVPEITSPIYWNTAILGDVVNPTYAHNVSNPNFTNASGGNATIAGTGNDGCLKNGERNSTWFLINVQTAGTLEFSMGQWTSAGNYYDWALWPYSPTACSDIANNTLAPLRCNWNRYNVSLTGIATPAGITNMVNNIPNGGNVNVNGANYTNTDANQAVILNANYAPAINAPANSQYLVLFSNWSNAATSLPLDFFGTAGISCTPLGDFGIDISGIHQEGKNNVSWYVSNEVGADYYVLERRTLEDNWELLTKVIVKEQNNGSLNQYSYVDETPVRGINYYRVKQYGNDGMVRKESAIIAIEQEINESSILSVFPNPTKGHLNVKHSTVTSGNKILTIYNVIGTQMYSEKIKTVSGIFINNIDVSSFSVGTYFVELVDETTNEKQVARFVKE